MGRGSRCCHRRVAAALAIAALAACTRRGGERETNQGAWHDAGAKSAPDARGPMTLGPLDRVRDRFDRACPPSTPRYPLASMIAITKHPQAWVCSMPSPLPAVWPAVAPGPGVRRVVSLALIERAGEAAVRGVAVRVQDDRAGAARPAACDRIVDELLAYVRDLDGQDRGDARRAIEVRDEDGFCEARIDAAALASPDRPAGKVSR